MNFPKWRIAVDKRLLDLYSIIIEDAGIDDDYLKTHWKMKQPPNEFIEWFGVKYDLTSRPEFE